ncbi:hypothetical protein IU427_23000 [Nocardia beijingensis]|uniref:DUF6779 domain-containing protein n=1 Tax=Nocardia beijingensis TaxID=95162 RepID=UPI00189538A8|nr:DUF6779 domain-containing protein [Nocardia beijingensis]MBF6468036.1 hypothetical protein [Nocardia beijingensis]
MVSPSRSSTSRTRRDDAGKLFVGVLIVLGLVASVFLIFSNSVEFVRVGLVAALWAAAIGALAATKYRKEATIDKAKVRDLQTVYELQLEREITARREYELGVEARVREEVGADAAELAALRAELTVLRQSLQRLFDGDLPTDRPALRADATRIQELTSSGAESGNNSSANAGMWSMFADQQPRSSMTPIFEPDHPEPPVFASPFDDPVTAETAIVSLDDADDADQADAEQAHSAEPRGWADAFTEAVDDPPTQPAVRPRPKPEPAPRPASAPAMGTPSARRRRRADSDDETPSRRLSVAEIMANLQSEERERR